MFLEGVVGPFTADQKETRLKNIGTEKTLFKKKFNASKKDFKICHF